MDTKSVMNACETLDTFAAGFGSMPGDAPEGKVIEATLLLARAYLIEFAAKLGEGHEPFQALHAVATGATEAGDTLLRKNMLRDLLAKDGDE